MQPTPAPATERRKGVHPRLARREARVVWPWLLPGVQRHLERDLVVHLPGSETHAEILAVDLELAGQGQAAAADLDVGRERDALGLADQRQIARDGVAVGHPGHLGGSELRLGECL